MGTTEQPTTSTAPATTESGALPAEQSTSTPPAAEEQSKTQFAIGTLPDDVKQALVLQRQRNIVSAQIAGTNWGKGLDLETRRAISDWGNRVGIDPATELYVLGGSFYKNANYYMRRLSEISDLGRVVYAYVDHVEVDDRLEKMTRRTDKPELAAQARDEIDRRTMMRVQYQIPDKAEGASVFHIMLSTVPHEFSAAKWCGGGTRKKDPVGDEFPVETSETRAVRRCMRLVASQNPAFKPLIEPNDDDSIDGMIGDKLRDGLMRAKQDQIDAAAQFRGKPLMAASSTDPYAVATVQPNREEITEGVPAERPAAPPLALDPIDSPVPPIEFQDDTDLQSPEERARFGKP